MTKATGTTQLIQEEEILNNEEFGEQLEKIAIGLNNLADQSYWKLGDIRMSVMTESVFQAKKGDNWVRIIGQDITGSDLDTEHGISLLPDLRTNQRTLGQVRTGESVFDLIASTTKSHSHRLMNAGPATGSAQNYLYWSALHGNGQALMRANSAYLTFFTYVTGYSGDNTYGRPNSIAINYFVKINNEPTNF